MNEEEFRQHLSEVKNIDLKSIRLFKHSFHVVYWTPEAKIQRFYRVPLSSVSWEAIKREFYE